MPTHMCDTKVFVGEHRDRVGVTQCLPVGVRGYGYAREGGCLRLRLCGHCGEHCVTVCLCAFLSPRGSTGHLPRRAKVVPGGRREERRTERGPKVGLEHRRVSSRGLGLDLGGDPLTQCRGGSPREAHRRGILYITRGKFSGDRCV